MSALADAQYLRDSSLTALENARKAIADGTGSPDRVGIAERELAERQHALDVEREYWAVTKQEMTGRGWTGGQADEVQTRYRQAEQNVSDRDAGTGSAARGAETPDDCWFSSGADAAHQDWLDSTGHVNDDADVDVL